MILRDSVQINRAKLASESNTVPSQRFCMCRIFVENTIIYFCSSDSFQNSNKLCKNLLGLKAHVFNRAVKEKAIIVLLR